LAFDHAQYGIGCFAILFHVWAAQVSAKVKEVVLDCRELRSDFIGRVQAGHANGRVQFINGAIGRNTGGVFGDAASIAEGSFTCITGFGVDFVENDHSKPLLFAQVENCSDQGDGNSLRVDTIPHDFVGLLSRVSFADAKCPEAPHQNEGYCYDRNQDDEFKWIVEHGVLRLSFDTDVSRKVGKKRASPFCYDPIEQASGQ
jgi:hypothetical protein